MSEVSFYDVKDRKKVLIPRTKVKVITTKRGQPCLVATHEGRRLFRFIKRSEVNDFT